MTERLTRLRGPAVLVLLVVLTLRILLAVAGFVLQAGASSSAGEVAAAGVGAAAAAADPLTAVVLAVLVGSCVLGSPVPSARTYRSWAVVVVGVGTLLSLVAAVAWLAVRPAGGATVLDAGQLLLRLALPVLVLVALTRLRVTAPGTARLAAGTAPAALEPAPTETAQEPESDPAQEPVWQPDQAAGAAWMKAGDAAAGAAASGWGSAADAGGWSPQVPREAVEPPAPTAGAPDAASPAQVRAARPDRPDSNVADRYRPRNSPGPS